MNSDVHRHQAHPPLAQHTSQSVSGCGWYAPHHPPPTAPARLKRVQTPQNIQCVTQSAPAMVTGSGTAPLSPSYQPAPPYPHHNHMAPMSSSVRVVPNVNGSGSGTNIIPNIIPVKQSLENALNPSQVRQASMTHMPWHHGSISRERAEQLLSGSSDGVFLVRESTNFPGDHTLCVRYRGRVEHYRIKWSSTGPGAPQRLTIDEEEFFDTMSDLIHHYLEDADGLCTQLVRCLPKQPNNVQSQTNAVIPQTTPVSFVPAQVQQQPPTFPVNFQPIAPAGAPDQPDGPTQPQNNATSINNIAPPHTFVDKGWIIQEKDLEIRESIGKGEFGDVMLAILHGTQKVAVKVLKDRMAASKFLAEASLMASLQHENLVRLLGLVFTSNSGEGGVCIVTEHMAAGSLLEYLRSRGRQHVSRSLQAQFARHAAAGMAYLERRRVVHRDLAARNVLIAHDGTAKVADFGLARTDTDDPAAHAKLPIKWTAPEALKYNKFSNKSDMWSFGILLWEIYSFGRVPYPRIPLAEVVRHVERGYRMEAPEGCPPAAYEMMRAAWHQDPELRPTFLEACRKLHTLGAYTLASEFKGMTLPSNPHLHVTGKSPKV